MPERVGEGAGGMAGGGVDDEAGGLVDDGEPLVLVDDAQLGDGAHRRRRRGPGGRVEDVDDRPRVDALAGPAPPAVDLHPAGVDERPRRAPAAAALAHQPEVETQRRGVGPGLRGGGHRAVSLAWSGRRLRVIAVTRMPTTMAASATLNTGQRWRSTKSTT